MSSAADAAAGGGLLMLNGNSWATIECGDKVGDNEDEEGNEDPLGQLSVLSSGNREVSERSITSLYSSSSAFPSMRVSSITACPPGLVLPVDRSTTRGGLKLRSKPPHTRIITFLALANQDELEGDDLNRGVARNDGP